MPRIYAENRIRQLREERGMSMEALALGIEPPTSVPTIYKLEKRQMALSLDYILQIARVLGVNPYEIVGEADASVRMIPVVGRITAGNWREAVVDSDELAPFSARLRGANLFALRVEGDSMDKIVGDGGLVVVDPDDRDLVEGRLYAVMNGDHETTFKRFCGQPPRLEPLSNNPAHQPIPLGREPFIVIGRIIHAGRDYD